MNKRQKWLIFTIIVSIVAGLVSFYIYLQVVPKPKGTTIDLSLLPDKPTPSFIPDKPNPPKHGTITTEELFGQKPNQQIHVPEGFVLDKPKITYLDPKVIQDYYFEGLLLSVGIMAGVWALWLLYLIPLAIIGLTRGLTSRVERANKETFWKTIILYILLLLTIWLIFYIKHYSFYIKHYSETKHITIEKAKNPYSGIIRHNK